MIQRLEILAQPGSTAIILSFYDTQYRQIQYYIYSVQSFVDICICNPKNHMIWSFFWLKIVNGVSILARLYFVREKWLNFALATFRMYDLRQIDPPAHHLLGMWFGWLFLNFSVLIFQFISYYRNNIIKIWEV